MIVIVVVVFVIVSHSIIVIFTLFLKKITQTIKKSLFDLLGPARFRHRTFHVPNALEITLRAEVP
jgi:hypothetical protein